MKSVKSVSTNFFVGSVVGGLIVGVLFLFTGAFAAASRPDEMAPVILLALGLLLDLYVSVVFLVLLYKAWACIQDGGTRTTPGQAIGFLFIPIFNWYWVFRAMPGFADEYNSYLDRSKIPAERLTKGSLQALAVCSVLSIIPLLGGLAALAALLLLGGATDKLCAAINALAVGAPPILGELNKQMARN
jgi:cytochrome bd-type quinol oxidase subunit 2